jgi:hypothetical protein
MITPSSGEVQRRVCSYIHDGRDNVPGWAEEAFIVAVNERGSFPANVGIGVYPSVSRFSVGHFSFVST